MKAFVINLERRKDRYEHIMNNYHSNNYSLEIIKAYDGRQVENNSEEYENIRNYFLKSIENNLQKTDNYPYLSVNNIKNGELGCFLSHIIIWKKMIDENIDKAIIYEDDCLFTSNFENKLKNILENLPPQINMVWLGGKWCDMYSSIENKGFNDFISIFNEKFPYCAFSYLISLEGAKKLYYYAHNIFKGKLPVDWFMFEFFKHNNDIQYTVNNHITWSKLGNYEINNIFSTDIQNE
jgi:GR25 family glycosyltransferase involved in LPS biosynthesis